MKERQNITEVGLIPVRRPITGLTVDNVAQVMYNRLIAEWGLANAKQIGAVLADKLSAETTRRKKL